MRSGINLEGIYTQTITVIVTTIHRENNFNLLRLVLASLVIIGHSPDLVIGSDSGEPSTMMLGAISLGELAVDGFFLLSGYLILQSWHSQPNAWSFLKKRVLRIYPGYLAAGLICAFLVGPLGASPSQYFASMDFGALLGSLLLLQVPAVPEVFSGQPNPGINGSMWTISREFMCYLLVLALGVVGALRVRHFWLGLTAAVLAALVFLKLSYLPSHGLRLWSFFLAGGCYYLYRERVCYDWRLALILASINAICLLSWRLSELALATVGGYVLFYLAGKRFHVLSGFNRFPDVSYGVYLYGWPIQKLLVWYFPTLSHWELSVLALMAALLVGTGSWYLIEKPALRFKEAATGLKRAITHT